MLKIFGYLGSCLHILGYRREDSGSTNHESSISRIVWNHKAIQERRICEVIALQEDILIITNGNPHGFFEFSFGRDGSDEETPIVEIHPPVISRFEIPSTKENLKEIEKLQIDLLFRGDIMKINILTHRLGIEVPCGDHRKKRIVIIDDLPSFHMNFQSMAGMLDMNTSFFQFLDDLLICLLISTSSGFDIGIYEDSISDKIF